MIYPYLSPLRLFNSPAGAGSERNHIPIQIGKGQSGRSHDVKLLARKAACGETLFGKSLEGGEVMQVSHPPDPFGRLNLHSRRERIGVFEGRVLNFDDAR